MATSVSNGSKRDIPIDHHLYQSYDTYEDMERSRSHYEQDPRFYYLFSGGEWNVYSGLCFPREQMTVTEAQEAKLDILAEKMELRPGKRILDVGCGWGGPLTYLCKKYGVSGLGITVSPRQREAAEQRAKKHGVNAEFRLVHWEEFEDNEGFDAVYSDEVIVHFNNLGGFFNRVWQWLRPGGLMVNKELHYTYSKFADMSRAMEHVNSIFGYTGNYRLLAEELQMMNDNGFELINIHNIPLAPDYHRTLDVWLGNMSAHREEMIKASSKDFYDAFRKYLRIVRMTFKQTNAMLLDVITGKKADR
jgi:cyclopropane-fatty-acyl-phospholipid synthase